MYIYHALINALSAHIIHINLNTIFCIHAEDSPTSSVAREVITLYFPFFFSPSSFLFDVIKNQDY